MAGTLLQMISSKTYGRFQFRTLIITFAICACSVPYL